MSNGNSGAAGGGAIYALGIFGAWVWFWQQADSFWEYVLAVIQGLFWPAWMVSRGLRRAEPLSERRPLRRGVVAPASVPTAVQAARPAR